VTATDTAAELARIAGHAASDKLATDIVLIDVSDKLAITDVFVIATGSNERQVEAIVDEVEEKLRFAGRANGTAVGCCSTTPRSWYTSSTPRNGFSTPWSASGKTAHSSNSRPTARGCPAWTPPPGRNRCAAGS
jgi:hypothetical protein